MRGFITEKDFTEAEIEFPGIVATYRRLPTKPPTFLDLLRVYLDDEAPAATTPPRAGSRC